MRIPEPKISVALCTYNGATYLHEQLATLTGQSRLPDDLVICDDRSTDKTLAIARSFARGAPFSVSIEVNEKTI
jgi:glycosyltransferase involved in cell wall biosynthesis